MVAARRGGQFRNRYILLADLLAIVASAYGAYSLRFDWLFIFHRSEFPVFLACVLVIKPAVFLAFGLYRRYWRYASLWDLIAVVLASSAATVLVVLVMVALRLLEFVPGFPRSVPPTDWLLTMTLAGGIRMSVRVLAEMQHTGDRRQKSLRRVLVIGAGNAAVMVLREMQRNPQLGMIPVGMLDDDPAKQGKTILGVPVLGSVEDLARHAEACGAHEVIIAIPTASGPIVRAVVERSREANLPSKVIPGVFELLDGKVSMNRLRSVEISDLLRRSQVALSTTGRDYLRGRTVLITGAGGSIGSELCRQVARDQPRLLVLLGHGENSLFDIQLQLRDAFPHVETRHVIADVRNRRRLTAVFDLLRPDVVFHAAAHKHVPLMEENPEEAITNNVLGTRNVVDAAVACGVDRLVMISTDKAVAPMNFMGASKRVAEMVVRSSARQNKRRFAVVRFGNVLGSRGSVVPLFKAQIERGGPMSITHPDMRRFFMTIPEAVHLVLEAGGYATGGELFVLNMGQAVRIVDLAQDLVELSGLKRDDIAIEFTGLRPGEKLDEQLWETGAVVENTPNPDVWSVRESESEGGADLPAAIDRLERAATGGNTLTLQACLADLISSFAPLPPIDRKGDS